LDFTQSRLQNSAAYFEKYLKKYCSDDQDEQLFFKYFPIKSTSFEKTAAVYVVCSSLVADEFR
jgi:hypothetical protein